MSGIILDNICSEFADVWIAAESGFEVDYSYGGTRLVDMKADDDSLQKDLIRLMRYESGFKNQLINIALRQGVVTKYKEKVPLGFLESSVGGARCLIRPNSEEVALILQDFNHPRFLSITSKIFENIGQWLNAHKGSIKLTPDFGRFAGFADILYEYTEHVLGVRCEIGGCGGKASYTVTGILAAIETLDTLKEDFNSVTVIGSAGAMGSMILEHMSKNCNVPVGASDVVYNNTASIRLPPHTIELSSKYGMFTEDCLKRGGLIIATTVGNELGNSNWKIMPDRTLLLLAHNLAIPTGDDGVRLMRTIDAHGVYAIPGQVLTLGGALTSRLEWFCRKSQRRHSFDKKIAHEIVKDVVSFWTTTILIDTSKKKLSPYEAMLKYLN